MLLIELLLLIFISKFCLRQQYTVITSMSFLCSMGKASDTSPRKCREIQTLLLHSTHSQRDIATIASVSKSVVNRIKIKLDQNKSLVADRVGKCGRKRITTPRTDRKIRDICLENRKKSVARLTTMINDEGIKVSKRTVRRRLVEENLIGRRPIKKPRLTEAMKKKRLQWAKQHRNMTVSDWNRVNLNSVNNNFYAIIVIFYRYASPMNQHSRFWSIKVHSSDDALESSSTRTASWRR
jgi:Transposase.